MYNIILSDISTIKYILDKKYNILNTNIILLSEKTTYRLS